MFLMHDLDKTYYIYDIVCTYRFEIKSQLNETSHQKMKYTL